MPPLSLLPAQIFATRAFHASAIFAAFLPHSQFEGLICPWLSDAFMPLFVDAFFFITPFCQLLPLRLSFSAAFFIISAYFRIFA